MSTSPALLRTLPTADRDSIAESRSPRRFDVWMLAGIAVALIATVSGIASTGISLSYFFQPTGTLIVLGGTVGVMFITTPRTALLYSAQRMADLFWTRSVSREDLIEEIVLYARTVRTKGLYAVEAMIEQASNSFLADSLLLAMDVKQRSELQSALENKLRLRERQGEADARILEVAGGFAPTIGVLGTVVGLIDVLRRFSTASSVAYGVGTAFVSTIYGLALANLVLLPAAHRIRAKVAEVFETQELMAEGALCLFDGMHPSLIRQRLTCFLREADTRERPTARTGTIGR